MHFARHIIHTRLNCETNSVTCLSNQGPIASHLLLDGSLAPLASRPKLQLN